MGGSGNLENDGAIGCWGLDNKADDENGKTEEMLEGTGAEEVENGTKELLDVEEEAVNEDLLEEEDKTEFLRFMAALSSGLSSGFLYFL